MNKSKLYMLAALSAASGIQFPEVYNSGRRSQPREKQLTAADIERIQAAEQKRERKRQKALASS